MAMATTTTSATCTPFSTAATHHQSSYTITKLPFTRAPSNSPAHSPNSTCHHPPSPSAAATTTPRKKEETSLFRRRSSLRRPLGESAPGLHTSLAAVNSGGRFSGILPEDRSDFSYDVIKDVQVVPRFIGEWGDVIITLRDGTKVDLRSVPKFREIAKYCLAMADKPAVLKETGPKGF
ncbi:UNVERIFIED_CONTAM: hypothetical protein Sradi_4845000 [Sesamum radiatum]|uniref:YdbS-like PH domain-containing protein n=1 Tax=Sesamum radiatum TaxID=300843 RepID=A0AAW2MYW2_SESRA